MVKRWRIKWDGIEIPDGEYVRATDYEALAAELKIQDDANDILTRRVSELEAALRKARAVWHNHRLTSTSIEDNVLREVDAALSPTSADKR